MTACRLSILFQFHNGTIKRTKAAKLMNRRKNFNSIMVRLKAGIPMPAIFIIIKFQFHNGTIKRSTIKARYDYER